MQGELLVFTDGFKAAVVSVTGDDGTELLIEQEPVKVAFRSGGGSWLPQRRSPIAKSRVKVAIFPAHVPRR